MLATIFDFDGTLADSLPAHIRFLHYLKTKGFACSKELPNPEDLLASQAITSSPMGKFFIRAGFRKEDVPQLWEIYQKNFSSNPACKYSLFEGVPETIARLKAQGLRLGIISSNVTENIFPLPLTNKKYANSK